MYVGLKNVGQNLPSSEEFSLSFSFLPSMFSAVFFCDLGNSKL